MTDIGVVKTVIKFLGWLAVLLVLIVGVLAWRILSKDKISPEDTSVLTPLVGLAGTAIGAVGALLVSTHSSPPDEPE